ncbi:hypothetical protein [uncultured Cohaesibacter sp.]|uniref:hypothetical protein n=1 Tax=uncultured Cohaesibacter sp. TaxID=1002546 RepID=UPI0029304EAF|nr:hypothetical protein [uncultured Cohaesibacter sp.]
MDSKVACQALNYHDVLKINYHGYDREVEVHAVGKTLRGNEIMYVYQTAGGARNGNLGWKRMLLEDARFIDTISGASRAPRSGYDEEDSHIHDSVCAL